MTDLVLDASLYANSSDFETDFDPTPDQVFNWVGSPLIVSSGEFRSGNPSSGLVVNADPTDNDVFAEFTHSSTFDGDAHYLWVLDASGDGYAAKIGYTTRLYNVVAYAIGSQVEVYPSSTAPADGDVHRLSVVETDLIVTKNSAEVVTITVTSVPRKPGMLMQHENSANTTISSFVAGSYGAAAPAINPTGTDLALTPGATRSCVMSGITDSAPVSIAVRWTGATTITETQADFSWSSGTNTISYTATRGALPYGASGYELRVTLANASVYTLSGASIVAESGFQVIVTGADPIIGVVGSIAYDYTGDDPEEGYQFRVPLLTSEGGELTLNTDLTYGIDYDTDPQPETDTIAVEAWDGVSWSSYTVTINAEDPAPEVTLGIVSINGGDPVEASTSFNVVIAGINAADVTTFALQDGANYYACPITAVVNATTFTATGHASLPTGLTATGKLFVSKHATNVRELISGIPAQLTAISDAVTEAENAATAAIAAQSAAETAAETAGKSAYEIAVDEGFVGDEAAWLLSLKGDDGDAGATGATGATGPQGDPGVGISILGEVANEGALPGSPSAGDAYIIGADLWVYDGADWNNVGTIVGPEGKSAYEIAVDNGFVGDEAAWLLSLRAPLGFVTAAVQTFTSADEVSSNIAVTLDCSAYNCWLLDFNGSPLPSAAGQYQITIANLPTGSTQGFTGHIRVRRMGRKTVSFILPGGITATWVGTPAFGNAATSFDLIVFYWMPDDPTRLWMSISDSRS